MTGMNGKVIVITGASSGIGRAAALLLAGRGAKVVLGALTSWKLSFARFKPLEGTRCNPTMSTPATSLSDPLSKAERPSFVGRHPARGGEAF
jgi:NAD(P)-dependent dehydrogenase (short-subunit alcohol dehydrogenase family)